MNDDLTIFLPLKGRHLHTLRWLWHANRTSLPYRVIIADGDVHPTIERLLSDPGTFPRLRLSYHRYADRSFSDFYRKCSESLERVDTPYVMVSDNDDFLFLSGLNKCMAFLNANEDFVCSRGGVPGFDTAPREDSWHGVVGPLSKFRYRCHDDGSYDSRNFDQPTPADRVVEELRRFLCIFYSVYRTEVMRTIMQELEELDFSDLLLHEYYAALRALTLGKTNASGAYLSYFRQGNTSMRLAFASDWIDHLLRSRFPLDFQAMAHRIATQAAASDDRETERLEAQIYDEFAIYLRRMLAHTLMRHRFPRLFVLKQRLLRVRKALSVPPGLRVAREERDFWRRLAADGASPETLATHRAEMAQIRETLTGDEFVQFVMRNAPDLAPQAAS